MGILIFILVSVAIVALVGVNSYNSLIRLRNRYKNAYAQIDVQLRRRYDLIPNLVETVKGYLKHERETLEAVVAARNVAIAANSQALQNPGDRAAIQQVGEAEAALTGALGRIFALAESYPDLKADRSMTQLMEELASTENRIAFARQSYNDSVMLYNTERESFPSNLVAGIANCGPAELLEDKAPEIQSAPQISF